MLNNPIINRVEIRFWDIYTDLLTKNPRARKLVRKVYTLTQSNHKILAGGIIGLCAMAGLSLGYILGLGIR